MALTQELRSFAKTKFGTAASTLGASALALTIATTAVDSQPAHAHQSPAAVPSDTQQQGVRKAHAETMRDALIESVEGMKEGGKGYLVIWYGEGNEEDAISIARTLNEEFDFDNIKAVSGKPDGKFQVFVGGLNGGVYDVKDAENSNLIRQARDFARSRDIR